jgi:N-glycosylase/DNA lyase
MNDLLIVLKHLTQSPIKTTIDARIKEFKEVGKQSSQRIFQELCFCLLTANCAAERCIQIQEKIGSDFLVLPEKKLAQKLKRLGYRFPNTRAHYIATAQKKYPLIMKQLETVSGLNLREKLVKEIKGIGYKEASHFLRNIGYDDYAIIDFHIIDLLVRHNLISKPTTVSKKQYLTIENVLKDIAKELKLSLAELDLYLWFLETGKILK